MTAIVLRGDARDLPLPDESVDLIVTSPPYFGLRDYQDDGQSLAGQIGAEKTPRAYVSSLLDCTREWMRVLKPSGSLFVNLGDSYYSGKGAPGKTTTDPKNAGRDARRTTRSPLDYGLDLPRKTLIGLPWRYALGCLDELGLILRAEVIWNKPNGLPESVTDRVRRSHEQVFHLTKLPRYYTAVDEIREPHAEVSLKRAMPHRSPPGRRDAEVYGDMPSQTLRLDQMNNPLGKLPGSVWEITSQPFVAPEGGGLDHYAAFPMELPRRIILGWSPPGICTACGEGRRPDRGRVCEQCGEFIPTQAKRCEICGHVRDWKAGRSVSSEMKATDWSTAGHGTPRLPGGFVNRSTITGYACGCAPDDKLSSGLSSDKPALVLDPFGGTGTTALVADVLGRTGISVDRSADYCRLARWRTTDPGERARAMQVPKPAPVPDGQGSLFSAEEAS